MPRVRFGHLLFLSLAMAVTGCGSAGQLADRSDEVVTFAGANDDAALVGAGSTFAAPIMQEWIRQYRRVAPEVDLVYKGTGSGRGIQELKSGAADFAVSELSLVDFASGADAGGPQAIEVPSVAGAVTITFNLPEIRSLRLSPATLAAILSGKVTKWDDQAIREDNPGTLPPPTEIRVVRRSDASGTTQVLTQFLKAVAPEVWTLDAASTGNWTTGTAAEGAEAVIRTVKDTVGAIGYAASSHVADGGLGTVAVKNRSGRFVAPSAEAVNAAISGANPDAPGAYPISTVSFLVFAPAGTDGEKALALRHFAAWVLTEGQRSAEPLGYARVPDRSLSQGLVTVLGTG